MLRILVIVPTLYEESLGEKNSEIGHLQNKDNLSLTTKFLEWGPSSVESEYDERLASPMILEHVREAQKENYDAIFISCVDDVALSASREISTIPVVAPLKVSTHVASTLGTRFSIITVLTSEISFFHRKIREYGLGDRLASVRAIDIPVLDLQSKHDEAMLSLIREAKEAISKDKADTIVLGCTGMSDMARELQGIIGVPVIDPVAVSIRYAELLVLSGLSHSKIAYPAPPSKERRLPFSTDKKRGRD